MYLEKGELRRKTGQHKINRLGLKKAIILLGAKENPFPYYKQCAISMFMQAGLRGKSIAIQEAQTMGCAIVAVPLQRETGNR